MIDAYCHCGVSKYLPVTNVLKVMESAGVDRAVLVQHMGELDNTYLSEVITEYPDRFAGVGLVDPLADWQSALTSLLDSGCFQGLRIVTDTISSQSELCATALDLGLVLIVYVDKSMSSAVGPIQRLVAGRKSATVVLSHLGAPRFEQGHLAGGWEVLELATEPSVYVTLSGQSMYCTYPYLPLDEFVAELIQSFGADRIMWGSNFPVCGDAAIYQRDLALLRPGAWGLTSSEIDQILNTTAEFVWFRDQMEFKSNV